MDHPEIIGTKLQALHDDVGSMKRAVEKLTDAITKLAVVEERQQQAAQATERTFKEIEKIQQRLTALEQQAPISKQTNDWAGKLAWGAVSALAAIVAVKLGLLK